MRAEHVHLQASYKFPLCYAVEGWRPALKPHTNDYAKSNCPISLIINIKHYNLHNTRKYAKESRC